MSTLVSNEKKYKIVLIGQASVGKTCIIIRFSKNAFNSDQESTIGAAFVSRSVETANGTVSLQIWDTAGQERYRSLVPKYSQGASAIIIVFDITDEESFESAKDWLSDARTNHPGGKVIWYLVGNKCDLKPSFDLEKAKLFAQEQGLEYTETSAKTGQNIENLFSDMANMLPSLPSIDQGVDKKKECC